MPTRAAPTIGRGWSPACAIASARSMRWSTTRDARHASGRTSLEASEESFDELLRDQPAGPVFPDPGHRARSARATSRTSRVLGRRSCSSLRSPRRSASINRGDYCVSKAGLSMAARLFAVRLAEHGIPVFEVRPGIIETDMTAGVREPTTAGSNRGSCPRGDGDARRRRSSCAIAGEGRPALRDGTVIRRRRWAVDARAVTNGFFSGLEFSRWPRSPRPRVPPVPRVVRGPSAGATHSGSNETLWSVALLVMGASTASAQTWTVSSPDGKTAITVARQNDGALVWRVTRDGSPILADSPLGIRRADRIVRLRVDLRPHR